ncbi:nickel-dependent lactate racemase [Clostridium akagii]|uniref:nickel-dependent lactate racemase n=1 Tax=Clostridium akagii TaxID=91623 RepID=UPI00047C18B0|nr:nickel-dependent lactate racemase [Clostridium akagii]
MASFKIPYYKGTMKIDIPDENFAGVLKSKSEDYNPGLSEEKIVERALDNPIGSLKLEELVKDKDNMVIITSDHTRPVPSKITLPILLKRIRSVNPKIAIKILIATGFHRATTHEEMIDKFGADIVNNENIICHRAEDKESLVNLGLLPSGGKLWINKIAMETQLLIAEGFIEPHFFAGFSGGRKSILPGISGAETIKANHCSEFISSKNARTGIIKNNPIHEDMIYAAKKAKLAFILNVVLGKDKNIINAFTGHVQLAHEEGCKFVKTISEIKGNNSDIVVTTNGGYPLDQNIYQAVKGMTAAEGCASENGVIIMIASCSDGHGGESFYNTMANAKSPRDFMNKLMRVSRKDTVPDQWEVQILTRILLKHQVIIVTDMCNPKIIKNMHMEHAYTFDEALNMAFKIKGEHAKVTLIKDGVSSIVV